MIAEHRSLASETSMDASQRNEPDAPSNIGNQSRRAVPNVERAFTFADLSKYRFKDRLLIRTAGLVLFAIMKVIGLTMRFEVNGWENLESATSGGRIPIYTSWHNRDFLSAYFWRRRGIVVMTSQSFDGELIARLIQRLGFGVVRGSSTRGAIGAIVELARLIRAGYPAGLTVDGPKGPRYVVKMGAVVLAKKTGQPIVPFVITAAKYWEAKSWDRFQVPKPFTRVRVLIAPPILVPADADDEAMAAKRDELQQALDELESRGTAPQTPRK